MPQDAAARPKEREDCVPAARLQASGLSLQPSAHRDGLRRAQQLPGLFDLIKCSIQGADNPPTPGLGDRQREIFFPHVPL